MEFFDLTNDSDNRTFNAGELSGRPVRALDGNDTVTGASDDDDINGNLGNDIISGSDGRDFLRGGQGADTVNGGNGDDTVNGNIGNDLVNGNDGADQVRGGQNDDTLNGNDGDDVLLGDLGIDRTGGSGSDVFVLQKSKGTDTITDFDSNADRFFLEGLTTSNLAAADSGGNTTITDQLTGEIVAIVQGVNSVTVGSALGIAQDVNSLPVAPPGNTVAVSTRADLRGSAANAAAGSFSTTSIQPFSGWTGSTQITPGGDGWDALGSFDIFKGFAVFKINPDANNDPTQVLLELTGSGGVRFAKSVYNFAETDRWGIITFNLLGIGFTSATINILE